MDSFTPYIVCCLSRCITIQSFSATVGLGFSDSVYRIFAYFDRLIYVCGHCRRRRIRRNAYILLTHLQLFFIPFHLHQTRCSLFARLPTPTYRQIATHFTPGLYIGLARNASESCKGIGKVLMHVTLRCPVILVSSRSPLLDRARIPADVA